MTRAIGGKWVAIGMAVAVVSISVAGIVVRMALVPPRAVIPRTIDGSTATVLPGVHLIGELGPSAAYAIETEAGLVLIDSGLESDAGPLKAQLEHLGLDWKRIVAIFLTHVHGDHCGGAEHLREATGAKIHAGRGDAAFLKAAAPVEAIFSKFRMPNHTPHPTTVDVPLDGGETFDFGPVRIRAIDTPGHTPGSICYQLERDGLRVLFTGDVIMRLGTNPLGTYSAYLPERYRGNAGDYLATLHKLRAMPAPDLLLPGHPAENSGPQNPRLPPGAWEKMLDDGIHDLERLQQRYAADGADFLDGTPRELMPDLLYAGDRDGVAVYVIRAPSGFFVVNAPGGPGLLEFLRDALKTLHVEFPFPKAVFLTSCDDRVISGLEELLMEPGAVAVCAPEGLETLRRAFSDDQRLVSASESPGDDWPAMKSIVLRGRDTAPLALSLRWCGKSVLFTPRLPAAPDREFQGDLTQDLGGSQGEVAATLDSIRKLAQLRPDLWLPSVPANGQNANIYDDYWLRLIDRNGKTVSSIQAGAR